MADKWVILGRPECPWCDKVSALLYNKGIIHIYMNVEKGGLNHFLTNCGLSTVPQVFMNGFLIGGYDETERFLRYPQTQLAKDGDY
jgi:glutaredoxin